MDRTHSGEAEELVVLIGRMTVDEKIALLAGGTSKETPPIARLGIPSLRVIEAADLVQILDSPDGVDAAGFQCLFSLTATFNRNLSFQIGKAIGQDALSKGANVTLGPPVNCLAPPFDEQAEDPFLFCGDPLPRSTLAGEYVRGVQSEKVAVAATQGVINVPDRSALMGAPALERVWREIMLKPLEHLIKEADPWCFMPDHAATGTTNDDGIESLLGDILDRQWGYQGMIMSDMNIRKGAEPGPIRVAQPDLVSHTAIALREGRISMADINRRVFSTLRLLRKVSPVNMRLPTLTPTSTAEHMHLNRQACTESLVLLKNDRRLLPLDVRNVRKIALLGPLASHMATAKLSSTLTGRQSMGCPLDALRARFGDQIEITHAKGFRGLDAPSFRSEHELPSEQYLLSQAVAAAHSADVAIVLTDFRDAQGQQALHMKRPAADAQHHLVTAVINANPNTIVINTSNLPVAIPWLDAVPSLIQAWHIGSATGNAIVDVVMGEICPSGRLPVAWPQLYQKPSRYGRFIPHSPDSKEIVSSEFVSADRSNTVRPKIRGVEMLFPFGYGMSYTNFTVSDVDYVGGLGKTMGVTVSISASIKNVGNMSGQETLQAYLEHPAIDGERPVRRMVGFQKVDLRPREVKEITIGFGRDGAAHWDVEGQVWRVSEGVYSLVLATSAATEDVKASMDITAPQGFTFQP